MIVGAIGIYLVVGRAAELVCKTFGILFPGYASLRAVLSTDKDDDTYWLKYWMMYALLELPSFIFESTMKKFPVYWLIKAFVLVLFYIHPFHGAQLFYDKISTPLYLMVDKVQQHGTKAVTE